MKLFELFDKNADWKWESQSSKGGSAVFTFDNLFYKVTLTTMIPDHQPGGAQETFLEVMFEGQRLDDQQDVMSYEDVDTEGRQYEVFSTVFAIVKDWLDKNGTIPVYAESITRRARIYIGALKRMGWDVEHQTTGYYYRIYAYPPGYRAQ